MFLAKVYSELQVVYHMYLFFTTHPIQKTKKQKNGGEGSPLFSLNAMLSIVIFTYNRNLSAPSYYRV